MVRSNYPSTIFWNKFCFIQNTKQYLKNFQSIKKISNGFQLTQSCSTKLNVLSSLKNNIFFLFYVICYHIKKPRELFLQICSLDHGIPRPLGSEPKVIPLFLNKYKTLTISGRIIRPRIAQTCSIFSIWLTKNDDEVKKILLFIAGLYHSSKILFKFLKKIGLSKSFFWDLHRLFFGTAILSLLQYFSYKNIFIKSSPQNFQNCIVLINC